MSDDAPVTLDDLRQHRDARRARLTDRIDAARRSDAARRGTLAVGARVLDVMTGEEGAVISATPATSTGAARVLIRLDLGTIVDRLQDTVIVRPTPPSVA